VAGSSSFLIGLVTCFATHDGIPVSERLDVQRLRGRVGSHHTGPVQAALLMTPPAVDGACQVPLDQVAVSGDRGRAGGLASRSALVQGG
jgi:hypothetical protein